MENIFDELQNIYRFFYDFEHRSDSPEIVQSCRMIQKKTQSLEDEIKRLCIIFMKGV